MSETKKVAVVVSQKSAFIGFLLAFIGLGWFGIDRFYKGDIKLGLFKLFCVPLAGIIWILGYPTPALVVLGIGGFFWLLDWFLVPLGIVWDNKRKLAQINGTQPSAQKNSPTS